MFSLLSGHSCPCLFWWGHYTFGVPDLVDLRLELRGRMVGFYPFLRFGHDSDHHRGQTKTDLLTGSSHGGGMPGHDGHDNILYKGYILFSYTLYIGNHRGHRGQQAVTILDKSVSNLVFKWPRYPAVFSVYRGQMAKNH